MEIKPILGLTGVFVNQNFIFKTRIERLGSTVTQHGVDACFLQRFLFLIQKKFDDNKTFTSVTPLDFEGRKSELARIMGGLEITDTLLQSAEELEELLNQNLYSN